MRCCRSHQPPDCQELLPHVFGTSTTIQIDNGSVLLPQPFESRVMIFVIRPKSLERRVDGVVAALRSRRRVASALDNALH